MTKIIAEIASSHNGDIEVGKKMIQEAAKAGVDIVKFQSWQAKNVPDDDPDKPRYSQLELSDEAHKIYQKECKDNGVEFLTTCFDINRIPFLKSLGLKKVKVASFDLKSFELLRELRKNFEEVIVSTGQSTPEEVKKAAKILEGGKYCLMHCVSIYPCPPEKVNLNRMQWLKEIAPSVGYSDHMFGPEAGMLAIGMGCDYIEKHFTIDQNMEQPVHTTLDDPNAKPMTTHQMADEPPVFKELCDFNKLAKKMTPPARLEMYDEEKKHRSKYTGRLDGTRTQ